MVVISPTGDCVQTRKKLADPEASGETDADGTVIYIGKMAKELSEMAAGAGHDFLAYLLRMAHDEAAKTSEGS